MSSMVQAQTVMGCWSSVVELQAVSTAHTEHAPCAAPADHAAVPHTREHHKHRNVFAKLFRRLSSHHESDEEDSDNKRWGMHRVSRSRRRRSVDDRQTRSISPSHHSRRIAREEANAMGHRQSRSAPASPTSSTSSSDEAACSPPPTAPIDVPHMNALDRSKHVTVGNEKVPFTRGMHRRQKNENRRRILTAIDENEAAGCKPSSTLAIQRRHAQHTKKDSQSKRKRAIFACTHVCC